MRVGHAVVAQQLQRGAREAAVLEGDRTRLVRVRVRVRIRVMVLTLTLT